VVNSGRRSSNPGSQTAQPGGSSARARQAAGPPPSGSRASGQSKVVHGGVSLTRLQARPSRFRSTVRRGRKGTMISFWLSRPGRVVFLVRGPAPDCSKVGTFAVRGHRGHNRIRFTGWLRGTLLRPGTYTISLLRIRRSRPARPARVVVVVLPRRGKLVRRAQACSPRETAARNAGIGFTAPGQDGASGMEPRLPGKPVADEPGHASKKKSGVLGAIFKRPKLQLPQPPGRPSWVLGAFAFLLIALTGGFIVAYFVRSLRRPDL
jgi:hypothetical protein